MIKLQDESQKIQNLVSTNISSTIPNLYSLRVPKPHYDLTPKPSSIPNIFTPHKTITNDTKYLLTQQHLKVEEVLS